MFGGAVAFMIDAIRKRCYPGKGYSFWGWRTLLCCWIQSESLQLMRHGTAANNINGDCNKQSEIEDGIAIGEQVQVGESHNPWNWDCELPL
jgi:hypothetical protein